MCFERHSAELDGDWSKTSTMAIPGLAHRSIRVNSSHGFVSSYVMRVHGGKRRLELVEIQEWRNSRFRGQPTRVLTSADLRSWN